MSDETVYEQGDTRIDVCTLSGYLRVFDKGDLMAIIEDGGYTEEAIRSLRAEVDRLQQHITEIEQLHREHLEEVEAAGRGVWVSDEQIDAAVEYANECRERGWENAWSTLNECGIVACPKCGGTNRYIDPHLNYQECECPSCSNNGWIREEHGDE